MKDGIAGLESSLGVKFNQKSLLTRAVTHKSYSNENRNLNLKNNERLEFLGDSVLSLSVSTHIFKEFPDYPEGELAKMRAVIVSAPVLAEKARELNLGQYLLLGKGEEMTGGRDRDSILADAMEAIFGAIYLDSDFTIAARFVLKVLANDIKAVEEGKHIKDYKTMLQEVVQQESIERPDYEVIEEKGPDHNKVFTVMASHEGRDLGQGTGYSKKEAEQMAAKVALKNLDEI